MINYVAIYDNNEEPSLVKRFSSESGEVFDAELNLLSKNEFPNIPDEVLDQHINNILDYCGFLAESLEMLPDDVAPYQSWPVKNYQELSDAMRLAVDWWNIMYYKEDPRASTTLPAVFLEKMNSDGSHPHDLENEDHYHDPVTGDIVYTDSTDSHIHKETDQTEVPSA